MRGCKKKDGRPSQGFLKAGCSGRRGQAASDLRLDPCARGQRSPILCWTLGESYTADWVGYRRRNAGAALRPIQRV